MCRGRGVHLACRIYPTSVPFNIWYLYRMPGLSVLKLPECPPSGNSLLFLVWNIYLEFLKLVKLGPSANSICYFLRCLSRNKKLSTPPRATKIVFSIPLKKKKLYQSILCLLFRKEMLRNTGYLIKFRLSKIVCDNINGQGSKYIQGQTVMIITFRVTVNGFLKKIIIQCKCEVLFV